MFYLDTSVLVSALTNEADTTLSQGWLAKQDALELTISDWTVTEFASSLSRKVRTGELGADHRAAALSAFTRLSTESFQVLQVAREDFRAAARYADQTCSIFARATPSIWPSAPIAERSSARSTAA
jgi:uncharacterized protein